ncbi:unnamed protein product [Bursaphelenchus okinawaensis]|uniref:Sulfatase domain-containing protein n=1 Tax=Bursaphelenchus okinawaensis TaxID=465554 RepID=A0A811L011_9BILA|nr:unnamed protein product [Bursaphelenchus okinawaensis]CAG9113749.1 unnamed protein product [Bursaphelenchus okinawaensis]
MVAVRQMKNVFIGFIFVLVCVAIPISVYTGHSDVILSKLTDFKVNFVPKLSQVVQESTSESKSEEEDDVEEEAEVDNNDVDATKNQHFKIVEPTEFFNFTLTHPFENSCKTPFILPIEPDIETYVKHYRRVNCKHNRTNVLVEQLVDGDIVVSYSHDYTGAKPVKCKMIELSGTLKKDKNRIFQVKPWVELPFNKRLTIDKNNFLIKCTDKKQKVVFKNVYANVKPMNPLPPLISDSPKSFGVNIVVFDSTARAQFLRHMPESVEFMKRYNFTVLYGHNKVGDNSAINLVPLHAGRVFHADVRGLDDRIRPEMEIPKSELKKNYWDNSDFLIQKMKDLGCATLWNDDIGNKNYGLLNYYQFNGFYKPPANYYYRPFYSYIYENFKYAHTCVAHDFLGQRYIEIWEKFAAKFQKNCHFGFNFFTALTHSKTSHLELYDHHFANSLKRLAESTDLFENSFLFVMGDHGQRMELIQKKYTGRIEERMPMVGVYVPPRFREMYPEKYQNLLKNQNRLTTNFDLHDTLREILDLTEHSGGPVGNSLLKEISTDRNCKEAHVPENFCMCMVDAGKDWLDEVDVECYGTDINRVPNVT